MESSGRPLAKASIWRRREVLAGVAWHGPVRHQKSHNGEGVLVAEADFYEALLRVERTTSRHEIYFEKNIMYNLPPVQLRFTALQSRQSIEQKSSAHLEQRSPQLRIARISRSKGSKRGQGEKGIKRQRRSWERKSKAQYRICGSKISTLRAASNSSRTYARMIV